MGRLMIEKLYGGKTQSEAKEYILEQIIEGFSLRKIARDLGISAALILDWVKKDTKFLEHYTRARDAQGDTFFEKIIDIIEDAEIKPDEKRVRIDGWKWLAGKAKPEKYSEKISLEHAGRGGGAIKTESFIVSAEVVKNTMEKINQEI